MTDTKFPFEALVVRYAADVALGEALNLGVVLVSANHRYAGCRFTRSSGRLKAAFPNLSRRYVTQLREAFDRAVDEFVSTPLLSTDAVELFRSVVPDSAGSVQASRPIRGVTSDPERTMNDLFVRYVREPDQASAALSRTDDDVRRKVAKEIASRGLPKLERASLPGRYYNETFDFAWVNGVPHYAQPVSLDLADPERIPIKAASWLGRISGLELDAEALKLYLIVGASYADATDASVGAELRDAQAQAMMMLRQKLQEPGIARVVEESELPAFVSQIERDLHHEN